MPTPDLGQPEGSPVRFHFEGRSFTGTEGEPLARALFRNGVRTLSYSVKYHRPRGVFCVRDRCTTCLLEVDGNPGVRACTTPLRAGMDVKRQDFRPFYGSLLTAAIRLLPFPAGFYFRFFTRPSWVRKSFLGTLRRMAGVARVPKDGGAAAPQRPAAAETRHDVVVVGAGVSGMSAALGAAEAGARVLLLDEYAFLGGHALGHLPNDEHGRERDRLAAGVRRHDDVTVRLGARAQGFYPPHTLWVARNAGGMDAVHADAVVFATGAGDVVPLFANNDTPGIFAQRALRLLLERDDFVPGTRAVVYGEASAVPDVLALCERHGVAVSGVAFTGDGGGIAAERTVERARIARVAGGDRVREVFFETPGGLASLAGDVLLLALPGQPSFELSQQAGFSYALDAELRGDIAILRPKTERIEDEGGRRFLVGQAAGVFDWRRRIDHARDTGAAAAAKRGT